MIRWYLTPWNNPSKRIAGPYAERKDALRESVLRLSIEAKLTAAENFRMPALLVPTPVTVQGEQVETYNVFTREQPTIDPIPKNGRKLPDSINKLPKASLIFLCRHLSIKVDENKTKDEIIGVIERELAE